MLRPSGVAYYGLQWAIVCTEGHDSPLPAAVATNAKGKLSIALYVTAIGLAFVNQAVSDTINASVALIWFIPDRRIERRLMTSARHD